MLREEPFSSALRPARRPAFFPPHLPALQTAVPRTVLRAALTIFMLTNEIGGGGERDGEQDWLQRPGRRAGRGERQRACWTGEPGDLRDSLRRRQLDGRPDGRMAGVTASASGEQNCERSGERGGEQICGRQRFPSHYIPPHDGMGVVTLTACFPCPSSAYLTGTLFS